MMLGETLAILSFRILVSVFVALRLRIRSSMTALYCGLIVVAMPGCRKMSAAAVSLALNSMCLRLKLLLAG